MIPFALALAASVSLVMPTTAHAPIEGLWHNPKNTVSVKMGACGGRLCGSIVRATPEAEAAAHDDGTATLVGLALLADYHPVGRNRWSGQLFVPDLHRQVGSTITLVNPDTLAVKGCLISGFLCRTQTWHRD